jgi:hypothetical protein
MPTREVTTTIDTDAGEILPADDECVRLVVDKKNTAAQLTVKGLIDTTPSEGSEVTASLMGEDVFTGTIADPNEMGDGRTKIKAFDGVRDLKKNSLTQTFESAQIEQIAVAAAEAAGLDYTIDLPSETTSAEYSDKRCDEIIEKMADIGSAIWFVDASGLLTVTQDVAAETDRHQLEYVLDHSTGAATPPYQSVRVEGASPTSEGGEGRSGGRESSHLISSGVITATAGEGDPTYRYKDNDIRTEQQAQNVADSVLRKLKSQQKSGWIKIVGDASIRPYDTVTMPDHLGGAQFLVAGVEHTLGVKSGFKTKIRVGAPIV